MDPLGLGDGDLDGDGDGLGDLDGDRVGLGVGPPPGPSSTTSSAWYVPWPYQPCTYTVTDVAEVVVKLSDSGAYPVELVQVCALTAPETPRKTYDPWTSALNVYAVFGTRVRVCAHCAVSLPAAPSSAQVPEWACPVTALSDGSQVQPARVPVSKPGLLTRFVAAEALGSTAPSAPSTSPPAARPDSRILRIPRLPEPDNPLGKFPNFFARNPESQPLR